MTEAEIHRQASLLILTGNFERYYNLYIKGTKEDTGVKNKDFGVRG